MEGKEKEKKGIVRLGLIYSVEDHRFDIIYKDLVTNRIQIGLSEGQESEEGPTGISVA